MKKLHGLLFLLFSVLILMVESSCTRQGCTDHNSVNFDQKATIDDGSCITFGCNDENALNYNPKATNDDGSCIYDFPEGSVAFYTNLDCRDITLVLSADDTIGVLTGSLPIPGGCEDSNVVVVTRPINDPVSTSYRLWAYLDGFMKWNRGVKFIPGKCTPYVLNNGNSLGNLNCN